MNVIRIKLLTSEVDEKGRVFQEPSCELWIISKEATLLHQSLFFAYHTRIMNLHQQDSAEFEARRH